MTGPSHLLRSTTPRAAACLLAAALLPCIAATAAPKAPAGAAAARDAGRDWPAYGGDAAETHHSPLTQIDAGNVRRLGLAWSFDLSDLPSTATVPLAVNGVVYVAAGHAVVHAIDGRSGRLLWRFDPEVGKVAGHKLRGGWGSRGLAYWQGRLYVGTTDGRLIALDARTGKPAWSVMTVQPDDARYITGAPRVFNGKVVIGHGGGDYGPTRGYVTAYDARTGRQLWRFHTVPGDPAQGFENPAMAMAAQTWTGEWWKFGGGGTVWNAMTYDPEFNRIYLGTGNGSPWNHKVRSPGGGDNLFLCSIVALDADTGEYVWHYQVNPGESWDYNASMDMTLATMDIGGVPRKVLMQVPKNGFFYVLDRTDGKLISAEKIGKVTWAERIDLATGRPVEVPGVRYESGEALIWPGNYGAHNWQPMAYNPQTRLTYVPIHEIPGYFNDKGIDPKTWQFKPGPMDSQAAIHAINEPIPPMPPAHLVAWDPVKQQPAWRVTLAGQTGGGVLSTAGNLVFQGQADGRFVAYAADSGREAWSVNAGSGIVGAPISWRLGQRQYVTVVTGMTGGASLFNPDLFGWQARIQGKQVLTFALDARAPWPTVAPPTPAVPLDDPRLQVDPATAAAGKARFTSCVPCHGAGAVPGGGAPDLRASPLVLDAAAFAQVVREGALQARGMPRFQEITPQELESLQHYLRQRARDALAAQAGTPPAAGGSAR